MKVSIKTKLKERISELQIVKVLEDHVIGISTK